MPYDPNVVDEVIRSVTPAFSVLELRQLIARHLNYDMDEFAPQTGGKTAIFTEALTYVNRRDQLSRLVVAARGERPTNIALMNAEQRLGLSASSRVIEIGTTAIAARGNLEAQVQALPQQVDISTFLERVARAEPRVCRIEIPLAAGIAYGTGFLVGNDRVLTNWHVAAHIKNSNATPANVRLRFGYKKDAKGVEISSGRVYGLAGSTPLASKPFAPGDAAPGGRAAEAGELDYALLAVAGSPGTDSALQNPVLGGETRGFMDLSSAQPLPAQNLGVFVLGHPAHEPMAISSGRVLSIAASGLRMRHDAYTLNGSSGSPVFDANFNLVALHHAGDPGSGPAQFNQAIPLALIAADIAANLP
jgi:V8-like Glu-specific endopeptidase